MKEFQVFTQIQNTTSKKEKEATLYCNDSETLRKMLLYCYSPLLTYRVKQLDFPDKYNTVQPDISDELFQLLDLLASHTVGTNDAKAMIKRLLAKCTEDGANWVCKIISKDLKIGISESTINKAFPELVPTFKVQLALPMTEPKSGETRWDTITYPNSWIQEVKLDALRCIAMCDGEKVTFRSREGFEFESLDFMASEVLKLAQGRAIVLDGEIVATTYNPNCKVAKKNFEVGTKWVFPQSSSMVRSSKGSYPVEEMKRCLTYVVWDVVSLDYFLSQGKEGTCKPLRYRKTELAGMFEAASGVSNISLISSRPVESKEGAISYHKEIIALDEEGTMLKEVDAVYEFKRSPTVLKLKDFYTSDLRIIGAIEGTKGSKYEMSLGALVVSDDADLVSEVGTGIDDDLRLNMWFRHKRGELVGGIVEVIFQERTADNSLRLPVFVRERPEKTEISWG